MRRTKRVCSLAAALLLSLAPQAALAAEENFNDTADAAAASPAQDNANCKAAIRLLCDSAAAPDAPDDGVADLLPVGGSGDQRSQGKQWETGKEAFPGGGAGADNTVSWMSGRTNAVFSAPAPALGGGAVGALTAGLLLLASVRASRRKS